MRFPTICRNKYLNYTCLFLLSTSFLLLLYSLNSEDVANFFQIFSILILLQFASFFCGSFFGFLFGFPSHNNESFKDQYLRNSSLKEITSWLTKIIVGITLIEFHSLFHYFKAIIFLTSKSINNSSEHVVVIGAILLTYFILGFIVFFILSVTSIFEELVVNDKKIETILSSENMDPKEVRVDQDIKDKLEKNSYKQSSDALDNQTLINIDIEDKEAILKYVAENGVKKLTPLLSKRLGKFLLFIEEYENAAAAYENAYYGNVNDKFSLLNACYIRNKFLKDFDNSNNKLKDLIKTDPEFAPAFYNLACNYNRESNELADNSNNEYITKLKTSAIDYLSKAFYLDKGLYSEACKDSALVGINVEEVFAKSKQD